METVQVIVKEVDSKSESSVAESLAGVEKARLACEKAERHEEVDQLLKARNQLKGHLDFMKKKKQDRGSRKLSPGEVEQLIKKGDPGCPRGQAYKHRGTGKEIRCTGGQPVDMSFADAKSYWEGRGFKSSVGKTPAALKLEYGAELFIYTFASVDDARPAQCVDIYPPPGMSWQEAVSRATGIGPHKLKKGAPVRIKRGQVPVEIVGSDAEPTMQVRIGHCK